MKYKLTTLTLAAMLACGTVHAQSNKEMAAQIKQLQEQLQALKQETKTVLPWLPQVFTPEFKE